VSGFPSGRLLLTHAVRVQREEHCSPRGTRCPPAELRQARFIAEFQDSGGVYASDLNFILAL